ncbi:MAG: ribonuclease III domain-containing protein [Candidatus Methanoperedens sp.]|nr:ribonuclease III domain-containing protein [Candidatus Methanoperedens sp.]
MSNTQDNLQKFLNGIFALAPEEIKLYEEAFIHSSKKCGNNSLLNNQRLAFLGDSVLKLIIREHFYSKYPDWDKGKLTKICGEEKESNKNFANIAIKLELVNYMDIENRPPDSETHERLNAEALEALFGAIYLNRGFDETKRIVEKFILTNLVTVD